MMLPSQKNDRNFVTYFILACYNVTAYVPTDHYVKGWVLSGLAWGLALKINYFAIYCSKMFFFIKLLLFRWRLDFSDRHKNVIAGGACFPQNVKQ